VTHYALQKNWGLIFEVRFRKKPWRTQQRRSETTAVFYLYCETMEFNSSQSDVETLGFPLAEVSV